VTALKLAQRGDSLEISYTAPRLTAGGVRLGVLDVEILRADRAGAFLKMAHRQRYKAAPGESLSQTSPLPPAGTIVRVGARAVERGHVSGYTTVVTLIVQSPPPGPHDLVAELKGDAVALRWEGTVPSPPPSPSPSPAPYGSPRPLVSAAPGAVVSPTSAVSAPPETAASTLPEPGTPGPVASPAPPPAIPSAPLMTASPGAGPPVPGRPASPVASPTPRPVTRGFLVYRRSDPGGTYGAPLQPTPGLGNALEDRTVAIGQRWCYAVGTVISTEPVIESARTNEACVSVRDIVAPGAPAGVAALGGPDGIEVAWSPSPEADIAVYRVYRQAAGSAPQAIGDVKPPETSLHDATAVRGVAYVYTVTALDTSGNESPPSTGAPGSRP
jgi:hypothetical protein